jgi:hypothetical protein
LGESRQLDKEGNLRRSAETPLRFFAARQDRLKVRRLFLGGDDADLNFFEPGCLQPMM